MSRRIMRTAARVVPLGLLAAVVAACNDVSPKNGQNVMRPSPGTPAQDIWDLYKVVTIAAIIVGIAVLIALVYAIVRYRRRSDEDRPKQSHGNSIVEMSSVVGSFALLAVIGIPTVALIWKLEAAPSPKDNPLTVNVVGKQWWWQYGYPNPGDGAKVKDDKGNETNQLLPISTSTELHIPINRPIVLVLDGRTAGTAGGQNALAGSNPDVNHSFWIPELSGKRDMIPGRVNRWTIKATRPGVYLGQCAQYCGLSHANMRMRVIAHTESGYMDWVKQQRAALPLPFLQSDGKTPEGKVPAAGAPTLIATYQCTNCHVFNDASKPNYGPNLTHVGLRSTIGGGQITIFKTDNVGNPTGAYDLAALAHWIWDAPSNTYGAPMQGEGCRWPLPSPSGEIPGGYDPPPPCQGMPSFKEKSYVPTINGKPDTAKYPLMTFQQACEIAEYLAAGRPQVNGQPMPIDQGQCANPEAVK